MPFTARDAATIRQTILANRASRYRALGKQLSTVKGSDAYVEADAYSIEQELIEQQALALTNEFFPDTAGETNLLRHAALIGLNRKQPTAARLSVTVTGSPSTTSACTGKTLNAADGTKYVAVDSNNNPKASITLDGGGNATVLFLAQSTGSATGKDPGTILTWSTAPTGFNPTDDVASIDTVGTDLEKLDDLRNRVMRWWQERPGSGNRADIIDWAESISAVQHAFTYPICHKTLGPQTLGAVRVLILGYPAARTGASPFGIGPGDIQAVKDLFFGTGNHAFDGGKVSAEVDLSDWDIDVPTSSQLDARFTVVLGGGETWPFASNHVISFVTDAHTLGFAGDLTVDLAIGKQIAVPLTPADIRGGYALRVIETCSFGGGNTTITFADDLPALPTPGDSIMPAPGNWDAMLAAVLAVYDRVGPGDVNTITFPGSARWPKTAQIGPATMYSAALVAAVMGVPGLPGAPAGVAGVVSATTTAVDTTAAAFAQITPGMISFKQ